MTESKSRRCCFMEKARLVETLKDCDLCSTSYESFHQCYRDAAEESGRRARACMME